MTIIESLKWANDKLKTVNIDSPMLDAEIILAHILKVSKPALFAKFNDKLKIHEEELFAISIDKRMQNIPIAYIIGKKNFYNKEFKINKNVLIPRPATETLIDEALLILQSMETNSTLICDIGTGSGIIAVTLSDETKMPVIATDISETALIIAKQNAIKHNITDIDFQKGNLIEPVINLFKKLHNTNNPKISSVYPFKNLVICANLPYLNQKQMETLLPSVQYEPESALAAGIDGLDLYWKLFKQISINRTKLPRNIHIIIEIDPSQSQGIKTLIQHHFPASKQKIIKDLEKHNRIVVSKI